MWYCVRRRLGLCELGLHPSHSFDLVGSAEQGGPEVGVLAADIRAPPPQTARNPRPTNWLSAKANNETGASATAIVTVRTSPGRNPHPWPPEQFRD